MKDTDFLNIDFLLPGKTIKLRDFRPDLSEFIQLLLDHKPFLTTQYHPEDREYMEYLCGIFGLSFTLADPIYPQKPGSNEKMLLLYKTKNPDIKKALADFEAADLPGKGYILGYPKCCVDNFIALHKKRPSNDLVRITHAASARAKRAGYPFLLNNIYHNFFGVFLERADKEETERSAQFHELNADFPFSTVRLATWHYCSYHCRESLRIARDTFSFMKKFMPRTAEQTEKCLKKAVIYFEKYKYVVLDPVKCSPDQVEYAGISKPASLLNPGTLAAFRRGNRAVLAGKRVKIFKDSELISEIKNVAPLLMDFTN